MKRFILTLMVVLTATLSFASNNKAVELTAQQQTTKTMVKKDAVKAPCKKADMKACPAKAPCKCKDAKACAKK